MGSERIDVKSGKEVIDVKKMTRNRCRMVSRLVDGYVGRIADVHMVVLHGLFSSSGRSDFLLLLLLYQMLFLVVIVSGGKGLLGVES
jgi:hypothetical protein